MRFVRTKRYLKDIKRLALVEQEIVSLEAEITASPTADRKVLLSLVKEFTDV